jgi:hypothetical protein
MISKNLLNLRIRSVLKKNKMQHGSTPWYDVKSIGILYTTEDKAKHELVKELIKTFDQANIKTEILTLLPKNKENFEFKFDFFTEKEISMLGNIHSESAKTFSNKPFDYLVCFDLKPGPYQRLLMASSKSKCRVGKFNLGMEGLLELMVDSKPDHSLSQFSQDIVHYLRAIR